MSAISRPETTYTLLILYEYLYLEVVHLHLNATKDDVVLHLLDGPHMSAANLF